MDKKINNFIATFCGVAALLGGIHPSVSAFVYNPWFAKITFLLGFITTFLLLSKKKIIETTLCLKQPFYILFFLFIAVMLTSSLYNLKNLPNETWKNQVLSLGLLVPAALILGYACGLQYKEAQKILFFLGCVALFHFLILLLADPRFVEGPFRGLNRKAPNELALYTISNYFTTSVYLGICGILSLGKIFYEKTKKQKNLSIVLFYLSLIFLTLTGSRSPLIAFIIAIIYFFIAIYSSQTKTRLRKNLNILLGLFVIAILFFKKLKEWEPFLFTTVDRLAFLFQQPDQGLRIAMFKNAFLGWIESPKSLVFGHGLGGYGAVHALPGEESYPHNFFLETLHDGGLFAGAFLFIASWFFLKKKSQMIKSMPDKIYLQSFRALFIFFLLTWQFVGGLESLWLPVFFGSLSYSASESINKKYA